MRRGVWCFAIAVGERSKALCGRLITRSDNGYFERLRRESGNERVEIAMGCVAEFSAHQFKGSKECAEAGHVRALRYEGNSSASRLRTVARCVQEFKGSKERKECARIACACQWGDMKKHWNLGMLESSPKTLHFRGV